MATKGTLKYRKVTRTPQSGPNKNKQMYYATAVTDREMNFEEFVTHISRSTTLLTAEAPYTAYYGYARLPGGAHPRWQERTSLRPGSLLHRYDITCRGYQGQGIGSERGGRTPHPSQHQDLEQR